MEFRHLWTYWHQGWDQAPPLVQQCAASWQRQNPDWQVHLLDWRTLPDHVEFPRGIDPHRRDLTVQKVAALARLGLLAEHGGAWADATTLCTRPVSTWLDEYRTDDGFFAFRSPAPDRLMSNWFIAAEPSSVILHRLAESFTAYYRDTFFFNQATPLGDWLGPRFEQRWSVDAAASVRWRSWFARKVLRIYPYFAFHYTFNDLVLNDPECRRLWATGKPYSALPPHRLQQIAGEPDGLAKALRGIDSGEAPIYKLDWRLNPNDPYWTGVLQRLEAFA